MPAGTWERRAAVAAFAAAVVMLVGYAYAIAFYPIWQHLPHQAAWTRIPEALRLLVDVGVPAAGGLLLLSSQTARRQLGAAVVGIFGLPYLLAIPGRAFSLPLDGGAGFVVTNLMFTVFVITAAVAGVLAAVALLRESQVSWTDPRRGERSGLRLGLLVAIVATSTLSLGPYMTSLAPVVWDQLAAGTGQVGALVRQVTPLLLEGAGWLVLATIIAGARPGRVAAAACGVVAAYGVNFAASNIIGNVRMETLSGNLMTWFVVHALTVATLIILTVMLWRTDSNLPEPREPNRVQATT